MAAQNGGARRVFVVGVGMTKFEKPGRRDDFDYPDMAKECVTKALEDAGISYTEIQQATVGYCYGESACGQRALYQFGLTGIPIYNVSTKLRRCGIVVIDLGCCTGD
ncbi:non-specific lipid-transfer protein-like 2 [Clytia hemisphaerica]|uniref:non-specific lipid-transfer protein-like 2 n=1 Tax=Clytia hemisphaerica TaxID=252671 RepID=UPI0034D5C535